MTIAEVKQLSEKMPVTDLHARFVKAYEKRAGESEHGKWSLQNFEIEDDTGRIIVVASNRPEDFTEFDWEGKEIMISAVKGKNGWVGALTFDDTYQGKAVRKIKLTKSGICRLAHNGSAPTNTALRTITLTLDTIAEVMEFCHNIGKSIYEDPQAAAAVGNTLFIAIANGKVQEGGENA